MRVIADRANSDAISDMAIKGKLLLLSATIFKSSGLLSEIINRLPDTDVQLHVEEISNPEIKQLEAKAKLYHSNTFDMILAIVAVSIIDAAKVLSDIAVNGTENSNLDDLQNEEKPSIGSHTPVLAVLTTSGTGAGYTKFVTVWDMQNGCKYSLGSEFLIPEHVILDHNLTIGLLPGQTLFTGLDALSHSTESLWNEIFNPLAGTCVKESIKSIVRALPLALEQPSNTNVLAEMQNASFLSNVEISQTNTAIAYAISYPLSYRFSVPHGLAGSFTIPTLGELLCKKGELDHDILDYIRLAVDFFKNLGLKEHVQYYLKSEELLSMLDEMNNPQRFSDFVLFVNRDELDSILHSSLSAPTA